MTKKHFERLARAVSTIKDLVERKRLAEEIAGVCVENNKRFNRKRFLQACGVEVEEK